MRTSIFVTAQFAGMHQWSSCPFPQVWFLKFAHRHIFHVRVELGVAHDDRDLEFFMVQKELKDITMSFPDHLGEKSCEMLCKDIYDQLNPSFGTITSITVSEDGENGATVHWD